MKDSDLFLLRIWTRNAAGEGGRVVLRGKVQHTVNGKVCEFKNWEGLVDAVHSLLPQAPIKDENVDILEGEAANEIRPALRKGSGEPVEEGGGE